MQETMSVTIPVNCMSPRRWRVLVTISVLLLSFWIAIQNAGAQEPKGLRGDPEAIMDAEAMVEAMGGMVIWRDLESVHFVHEWDLAHRPDRYLENEILDLTGPRSYVTMESEVYSRTRAYSPEYRYWNVVNGEFAYADDQSLANAMERAPYSIYRLARAIARSDERYELQFGPMRDVPDLRAIQFRGPDNEVHAWIILNARKEPIVWATTQYAYTFGPMKRFGNLRVPNWATTNNGLVRYEMVSLTGTNQQPDLSLFAVPVKFRHESR